MDKVFNLADVKKKKCHRFTETMCYIMLKGHDCFFDKFDHKIVNCFYFVFRYS